MEAIILMLKHIILTMLTLIALAAIVAAFGCGRQKDNDNGGQKEECSVSKAESQTTITCPDGSTAVVNDGERGGEGAQGISGAQGTQGVGGQNGTDGKDGTQVRSIIPCPQITTQYPEELFCINDALYAAYDAKVTQVHLTMLTPGNYLTTDGRRCHFTVVAGCVIQ